MSQVFSQLSDVVAGAVDRASASIVQVFGHHRPTAGVVVAPDLIASPTGAVPGDTASVRLPDGTVVEGAVLGHSSASGIAAIRVSGLGAPALATTEEPRVGHLAVAVGRTWSGGVTAFVTNVAVVGGPLRTSRVSQLDRVIRVASQPAWGNHWRCSHRWRWPSAGHGFRLRDPRDDGRHPVVDCVGDGHAARHRRAVPARDLSESARQRPRFLSANARGRSQDYGVLINGNRSRQPGGHCGIAGRGRHRRI